jgi:hypothetical protein
MRTQARCVTAKILLFFCMSCFTEPNSGSATVVLNKLNASRLKCLPKLGARFVRHVRAESAFDSLHSREREPRS